MVPRSVSWWVNFFLLFSGYPHKIAGIDKKKQEIKRKPGRCFVPTMIYFEWLNVNTNDKSQISNLKLASITQYI